MKPPVVQIVGRKKSGKTSLITGLTEELTARGYKVGTIKHTSHDHEFDRPHTDSWKHRRAGSETTIIISPNQWVCYSRALPDSVRGSVESLLLRYKDIILLEGYSGSDFEKIECVGPEDRPAFDDDPELMATVSEHKKLETIRNFRPGDIGAIADWLIRRFSLDSRASADEELKPKERKRNA